MNAPAVARYRDAQQQRVLIVYRTGRKMVHAIELDRPPVRLVRLPLTECRYMTPLEYKGRPYPLTRAVRRFLKAGRVLGITKGAAKALRQLKGV